MPAKDITKEKYRVKVSRKLKKSINTWRYRNKDSFPFISGDAFANRCDTKINKRNINDTELIKREIQTSESIFVEGHLLQMFLEKFGESYKGRLLVVGNSDYDHNVEMDQLCLLQDNVQVYLQNLDYTTTRDAVKVLPIGVENLALGVNGVRYKNGKNSSRRPKKSQVLVGPFSQTHLSRNEIQENFSGVDLFFCETQRVSPDQYQELLSQHRFVLCPRGNGRDTHRFWETLYSGGVPIVETSAWADHLRDLAIPFIITEKFEPDSIQDSIAKFQTLDWVPEEIPSLWMPYWINKMKLSQ